MAQSSVKWLFADILKIPNATLDDIVNELEHRAAENVQNFEEAKDLYRNLHHMIGNYGKDEDVANIRAKFNEKPLIFVPSHGDGGEGSWYTVAGCLWSSTTKIVGRSILETHYGDLRDFFVKTLRVETLSFKLVFDELQQLGGSDSASKDQVKEKIFVLNSFLENTNGHEKSSPNLLQKSRVFPVEYPNGKVELCTMDTDFVVVDRSHHGDNFRGQINMLDFTFDEICKLDTFLRWTGLQSRFTSHLVKEVSRVDESGKQLVLAKNCRIRSRAHAICRIAFHYHSPKLERSSLQLLFDTLRNARVYETDKISSELHISQGEKLAVHVLSTSELHIRSEDSVLEIFVPSNEERREFCLASKLPYSLFRWIMSDGLFDMRGIMDEKAPDMLALVLSSPAAACRILQERGIASIDIEDVEPVEPEQLESDHEVSPAGIPASQRLSGGEEPLAAQSPVKSGSDSSNDKQDATAAESMRPSLESPQHPETTSATTSTTAKAPDAVSSRQSSVPNNINNEVASMYRQLLERVVTMARGANFPSKYDNSMDMSALRDGLPTIREEVFSYRDSQEYAYFQSVSQTERDKMVGAAGELYVFELLKALDPNLPGLSIDNWQSTIRAYVNAHAEYKDILPWADSWEIADLMYEDTAGVLTALFINRGYLDESWRDCRPSYLLEVKTTTGPCKTPFYMSRVQYKRMRDCRNSRQKVYVVFRVFGLYQNSIGLRVYVNPAQMEDKGDLKFEGEDWYVVPGPVRK